MKIRYPKYYPEFTCIASACPDSCCKEWEVDVDPEAAALYRSLPGELGDRLRRVLRDGEDGWASMTITEDRRCPMWRQDGLCDIQAALGHDALCGTCRDFPRLRHDYGDFVELGLELSCPEAARLILAHPNAESVTETIPGSSEGDYDENVMAILKESRTQALALLQNPDISIGNALAALLLYGYEIHQTLDLPQPIPEMDIPAYLSSIRQIARDGSMAEIFDLYASLEILTPEWRELLNAGPAEQPWLQEHRVLACYLVERYWLQAVSDWDLMCRVKFIVTSCLMVRALDAPPLRAAQLYSKEIENDADNVDALLDAAYTSPALTDVKLLGLLTK